MSDRRGIYRAEAPLYEIEVQPDANPGDDGQSDPYAPDRRGMRTLLLVTAPSDDSW